jgi:hypothetical protein
MNSNEIKEYDEPMDKLIKDYPSVFKNMDPGTSCYLPSGWYLLVDKLCLDLSILLDEESKNNKENPEEPLFKVLQVKEKFGGLRFYYMMNTENDKLYHEIRKLIDTAEDNSYKICEITGKPGNLCISGMNYRTFCEEVRIKNEYEVVDNGNS